MRITALALVFAMVACGGSAARDGQGAPDARPADAPADTATAQYSGDVVGSAVPAEGTVVVIWIVVSPSPDYLYKFGSGASVGARYTASLSGPLPAEAINADGLALGFFGLLPKGTAVPDGKVDSATIEPLIIGASRNGLVFRTRDSQLTGWSAAFPAGEVSCGRCLAGVNPGSHETLEPAPCSELSITTTDAHACNVF